MLPVRTLAILAASAPALLASPVSLAGGQANIGLVSEYMRDGISYTAGEYAVQAGADYTHSSGLYGGVAVSEIKHQYETGSMERDLFGGWYLPATDDLALDVALTRYTFQGDRYGNAKNYTEASVRALYADSLTLGWRHTNNFLGSSFPKRTLELAYTLPLNTFGVEFYTAQHRYLGLDEDYNFGSRYRDTYWHFRVAGERTYNGYDYRLSLERTNLTSEYDAGTIIQFGIHRYFNLF